MSEDIKIKWFDAFEVGIEGKGWEDTTTPCYRLPAKAENMVTEKVWELSRSATGMCVNFRTDAINIYARWVLADDMFDEPNFNICSFSGLDLYGDDNGTWRWVATSKNIESKEMETCLTTDIDGKERDYRIYLPLRNPIYKLEIGVPEDNILVPYPPRTEKPLVFYGTSIIHGAYASHAGLVYPSIIGRRVNKPVINLGVSGNAKMEMEIADLLSELDAGVYIIDALPNMDLDLVNERAEKFIKKLRDLKPDTPIVMVEDAPRTNSWIRLVEKDNVEVKNKRYREIYEQLVAEGITGLSYIEGAELYGTDNEASIDGIHPGDLGYMRMADIITPVIQELC